MLGYRASVSLEEGLARLIAWRREILKRGRIGDYVGDETASGTVVN